MITADQTARIAAHFNCDLDEVVRSDGEFPDWQQLAEITHQILMARSEPARVIGISGSQGSGKSTLAGFLSAVHAGSAVVSLDDFYLTRAQRSELGSSVHPLLASRGVPGTHNHVWLQQVLRGVRAGEVVTVPSFDKAEDDRAGHSELKVKTLVFEGWCVGVEPQDEQTLDTPCNDLEREEDPDGSWRRWVNQQIDEHYVDLWTQVDFWIHLKVPSFAQVVEWRTQQEQALPKSKRMSDAEIARFVQHYERLTRHLWASPPRGPGLVVHLDVAHEIRSIEPISFR